MAKESIQASSESSQRVSESSSKLRVVVFGKTGTGKSSLINSLFLSGTPVAEEGDSLFSETKSVGCYTRMVTMIVNDVHVTLWDTPGLKDPESDGEKAIEEIREKCDIGDIDLFVYCTHFDQPRLQKEDVDCIRDITKAFGGGIWKRAMFALTFANKTTLPPSVTDKTLSEYFQIRLGQWRDGLHHFVRQNASEIVVNSIPVVPTGYKNLPLPDNRAWLFEFYSSCIAQVNYFALPAMKHVTDDRIKGEAEHTAITGDFEKRMAKEPQNADKAQVAESMASLQGSANHGATTPPSRSAPTTSSVDSITSGDSPGNDATDLGGAVTGTPNGSPTAGESGNTVVPSAAAAVESTDGLEVNGSQGSTAIVPLKDFRNSHPDYKAMQIVCNETFEELVKKYLTSSDRMLVEIKEKYMDEAFKGAKYFHSRVEVDLGSITGVDPIKKCLGDPVTFTNNENVDSSKTFTQIVVYITGTELTETVTSGWSLTGGLSAEYQGIGASTGIGYSEQQSETIKRIRGQKERKDMTDTFLVKPKSSRKAIVIRKIQRKECPAKNVLLSFPRNAELKCKFRTKDNPNDVKKKPRFLIREILKDYIESETADSVTAKLEGKCVWVETNLFVNVEEDKPL